jgi:FkbM family methyltransferase
MIKIWKCWDNNIKKYETREFSNSQYSINLDFFYNEIFNFEFSKTKCIYEMSNCLIEENDIVVDIGSNIGFFTRYAAEKSKKVISIEGSPEIFSCLVENNYDLNNVNFLNANIISENNKESKSWTSNFVPINLTIKDIFELYNLDYIDFLKVDIEGTEYNVFEDLDEEYIKRIRKISIETHDINRNDKLATKIINSGKELYFFNWYHGQEDPQTMFYFY